MQYSPTTAEAVNYMKAKYDIEPEFLWAKTPNDAVFRRRDSGKWFAVLLLDMPKKTLGLPGTERVDILDLKCDPLLIGSLLDGTRFLPGYHMNKEHWITLLLDGSIPLPEVFDLIDLSYRLTGKTGGKKC